MQTAIETHKTLKSAAESIKANEVKEPLQVVASFVDPDSGDFRAVSFNMAYHEERIRFTKHIIWAMSNGVEQRVRREY